MTDKEKVLTEIISNAMNINSEQNQKINELRSKNFFYREIINKQFNLLCVYADLFKKEDDTESDSNYAKFYNLLKEYGFESLSQELIDKVTYMSFSKESKKL